MQLVAHGINLSHCGHGVGTKILGVRTGEAYPIYTVNVAHGSEELRKHGRAFRDIATVGVYVLSE